MNEKQPNTIASYSCDFGQGSSIVPGSVKLTYIYADGTQIVYPAWGFKTDNESGVVRITWRGLLWIRWRRLLAHRYSVK